MPFWTRVSATNKGAVMKKLWNKIWNTLRSDGQLCFGVVGILVLLFVVVAAPVLTISGRKLCLEIFGISPASSPVQVSWNTSAPASRRSLPII